MTAAVLRRLAAMNAEELRFRAACEARKRAGRLQSAVLTPRWRRGDLAVMLADGFSDTEPGRAARDALRRKEYHAAHAALARHFRERESLFALGAARVRPVVDAVTRDFPDARRAAASTADRICDGVYDLLGYRGLEAGSPPDWHRDPVHDRVSPRRYWAAVPYLDPSAGDHKIIWELNRHQHWLALGRAHALTGDPRYYEEVLKQLESWMTANPPLLGTNWSSMLELALRSISWIWTLELLVGAADENDVAPWLVDLLLGLDRQLTHVEQNLSHYFSPNTHLSGEALALFVAGTVLPELASSNRRRSVGRAILVREARRQIRSDGGHAELSTHYHRYSTDFYLLATLVARAASDPAAPLFEEAARRQARYLRAMADDAGRLAQIGDDDGGQLFPICGRPVTDCRDTLATAAIAVDEPSLAAGEVPEESYWMCGPVARRGRGAAPVRWPSSALPASGYYVSRTTAGDHLVFDAGPHGYLNGGHAHADALSIVLSIAGTPVLIDPGTATYTMDAELRNRFRGTAMHNTLILDGRPQSIPRGSFHWHKTAGASAPIWRTSANCNYMEGTHEAFAPRRVTRGILAIHGLGWWILDHVSGIGTAAAELFWHIHPAWQCAARGAHEVTLHRGDRELVFASTANLTAIAPGEHPLAICSPVYGMVQPAPLLTGTLRQDAPFTAATFIGASAAIPSPVAIESIPVQDAPGPGWRGLAFRLAWARGAVTVLAAVEEDGLARHDASSPGRLWGTARLQTDGRIGAAIDRDTGHSETIVVNGRRVYADGVPLLALPVLTSISRSRAERRGPVAFSVHEVRS